MRKKIIRAVTVSQSCGFFLPVVPALIKCGYEILSVSSPGPELQNLRSIGIRCIEVPMERRFSILKDIVSLIKLIDVFREEKPYMVHSMTPKAGLLCMVAAWWTHVPVRVHTFTGLVWPTESGIKRKILMMTDKITCACATHVIPEGEGVKNDLMNSHITRKPMKVLGFGNVRGVDMIRFSHRDEVMAAADKYRDEGRFTFVFVGRIVRDKGINELVEAFSRLEEAFPNARLWLIGNYEDALDPITEAASAKIASDGGIEYMGPQYGDDLVSYLAAADCFVFPSYREGFPNTVMEAGAMGLPCIVTDINGSREIIIDGENGSIVPSKNADALYRAMKDMIANSQLRNKMASVARNMIAVRYDKDFVQQCLLDYYEEIMPS